MDYEYILFDLDGTLTESGIGITNAVMYALKRFGIEVSDRKKLYKFVGPPLVDSLENYLGFSPEQARTGVKYYREYYSERGKFENALYDGIEDLLKVLKAGGKTLLVATSKPEVYAKEILEHFKIEKYFYYIAGSDLAGTRIGKCDVIKYALESCGIKDLSRVLMIGDRKYDILGAKAAGVDSMGVLYGYGDRNELEAAGADYIAETVPKIGGILLAR